MRLIDMYRCSDVPYEQTTLMIDDGCVVAMLPGGAKILMAEYPSIEMAKNVMRDLRNEYKKSHDEDPISKQFFGKQSEYFYFPAEEEDEDT